MESEKKYTDEAAILCQILYGNTIFEIGRTAIQLGVFDALAEGEASCETLAEKCNVPKFNLVKILDALCALQILKKTGKNTYENRQIANKYLTTVSPQSIINIVEEYYSRKDRITNAMDKMKKVSALKSDQKNLFDQFEDNEHDLRRFHHLMESIAKTCFTLLKTIDLSQFRKLVDLGGSTGLIARKIADDYPEMEVISLDRPQTTELARSLPVNKNTRVKFMMGDFFKGPLPEADIYTICHVLLDWQDDECEKILRTVYNNLKPGGAVLILDFILNDDRVGPLQVNMAEMLNSCVYKVTQRSFADINKLLTRSGFGECHLYQSEEFSLYDGVMAKKL